MKRSIKCSFDISLKNWPVLLAFNMLYKMFSYSVLYSVTSDVLELIDGTRTRDPLRDRQVF